MESLIDAWVQVPLKTELVLRYELGTNKSLRPSGLLSNLYLIHLVLVFVVRHSWRLAQRVPLMLWFLTHLLVWFLLRLRLFFGLAQVVEGWGSGLGWDRSWFFLFYNLWNAWEHALWLSSCLGGGFGRRLQRSLVCAQILTGMVLVFQYLNLLVYQVIRTNLQFETGLSPVSLRQSFWILELQVLFFLSSFTH